MSIENCFILAAGQGTRMGEIGKVVPKVCWPIFDKSLLNLQITFSRSLGASAFYYNTHHLRESFSGLNIEATEIFEETLLDSGGAIHNLKSEEKELEKILLLNGDLQLLGLESYISAGIEALEKYAVVLFAKPVKKSDGYNQTLIKKGRFEGVVKNKSVMEEDFFTYAGVALINLKKIDYIEGASQFFDTVAKPKSNTGIIELGNEVEFVDWGTRELYWKNIWKIFKKEGESLRNYLIENALLQKALLSLELRSYNCNQQEVLNFTGRKLSKNYPQGSVIFKEGAELSSKANCLYFADIKDCL
jgi:choline kinase